MKTAWLGLGLVSLLAAIACKTFDAGSQLAADSFAACAEARWCISPALKARLNAARAAMPAWEVEERRKAYYTQSGKFPMPLDGTILRPFASAHQAARITGRAALHYHLRRAGAFMAKAFGDELTTITTCRLDQPNPDASDAHFNGTASDVAYVTTGSGVDALAPLDYERSFWLVYALMHRRNWSDSIVGSGNDKTYMLTDYDDELRAYARLAHAEGVISADDLRRFTTQQTRDKYRNHENHVHVDVRSWP